MHIPVGLGYDDDTTDSEHDNHDYYSDISESVHEDTGSDADTGIQQ